MESTFSIFLIYLRLGLSSFGGPIAHLGYFRDEFVHRRKWLGEAAYADLVALCQFLPGPASSQVGAAIGLGRGGLPGAFAAWLGFTLPSAVVLTLLGLGVTRFAGALQSGWLHGLKLVAVAIVAQALWGMGRNLCPDRLRATLAVASAGVLMVFPGTLGQVGVIAAGGIAGVLMLRDFSPMPQAPAVGKVSRRIGITALSLYAACLFVLPAVARESGSALQLFARFYRSGALVFGGGHVVLPLLQAQAVPTGMMSNDVFLAGYGAAQAVPGPLFTVSAYLGAASNLAPGGVAGAVLCLVAIFLPGMLLIIGITPFWEGLRRYQAMQAAMRGVNAAVVGILLAAFYQPVWTSAVTRPADFAAVLAAFLALVIWRLPPWLVVAGCAGAGMILSTALGGGG